ncbi:MAG: DinB family protein [Planctomycetes bacterium]|nr:DinB family protein [Planctomycetota bacterium]
MTFADMIESLDYNRSKTLAFIEAIAKQDNVPAVLGWRPGPGRAHIAWQLMHIAATDDRHVHVRMTGGQPQEPKNVERFAGGSTPDDDVPTLDAIKVYLKAQRDELLGHLKKLPDSALKTKPNEQAPWVYQEWLKVLAWHEAHHQGQAHLTFNLYKAAHGIK